MSVYQPCYTDPKTGEVKQATIWWYSFSFAGRRIRESSKSTRKTLAVEAEKRRRLELEKGFNQIEDRRERIRNISELCDEFFEDYKVRNPKSITFGKHALGHLKRLLGRLMKVDVTDETIKGYQIARLKEKASPKSTNDETGFLIRLLGEQGDFLRAKLKRQKMLKLKVTSDVARAYTPEEKAALLVEAQKRRSPAIVPALTLALHAGLRDAEIRGIQWRRLDLHRRIVTVGESKTEAGKGRTVPLNDYALAAMVEHSKWYLKKFGEMRPEWYVFPSGRPQPTDPTKPATTFKTVWAKVKSDARIKGRWHDNRHTFITDLAESGEASDETIMDLAGHVSKRMLKHYSHIRMEAKRRAVAAIGAKKAGFTLADSLTGPENKPYRMGTFEETSKLVPSA